MTDTTTGASQVQEGASEQQPSINDLAAFAFQQALNQPQAAQAQTSEETSVDDNTVVAPANEVVQPAASTPDYNSFVKETFGVDDVDTAKAKWQEFQALSEKPQTKEEIAFANEESKKIHQYLREGKTKEVYAYLDAQEKLANVDTMDADGQLRLFYKMQNPMYDDELIDLKLKREYGFDESDYKDEEGVVIDHVGLRLAKADALFKKQNDVEKAKQYFSQYKQKIELPDINTPQAIADEGYEAYKASTASAIEAYNSIVAPAVKALKETDVQIGVSVVDANNKMDFAVSIVPDATDFEAAKQDSLSVNDFLAKTCYDENGKFLPAKLQKMILVTTHFDKYVQTAARQAVNAERKRVLEQETVGSGIQRNFNDANTEQTELQRLAAFAFQKTG